MLKSTSNYRFGPYEFVPGQQEILSGNEKKQLTRSLNRLLLLLVDRPGEIVTREQIADALWSEQGTVDVTAGINTAINRLRTTIGDNNGHGVFIETVVGSGYRFTAPVEVVPTLPPELPPLAADSTGPVSAAADAPMLPRWRGLRLAAAAATCVLVLALVAWLAVERHTPSQTEAASSEIFTPDMQPITRDDPPDQLGQQAMAPSGRFVAYNDRGGLFVHTLDSGAVQRLAVPEGIEITRIAWYPDETAVLISGTAAAGAATGRQSALWKVPLAAGAPLQVVENAVAGAVSPDGNRLAFLQGGQSELWVSDLDGGRPHRLAQTEHSAIFSPPVWSPDSARLVVDRYQPAVFELAVKESPRTVTGMFSHSRSEPVPVYESYRADDGKLLAHQDGVAFDSAVLLPDSLYYVVRGSAEAKVAMVRTNPRTGAFRGPPVVATGRQAFAFPFGSAEQITASRDGRMLSAVLDRKSMHVFTADLAVDGGSAPRLEHEQLWSRHTFSTLPTAWSHDGRMVIADEGFQGPISIVGQTSGGQTQVFAASGEQDGFANAHFSADRRWLMYLHLRNGFVESIDRVPAAGGAAQAVPDTRGISEFRCSEPVANRCLVRKPDPQHSLDYYELDPVRGRGRLILRTPWKPSTMGDWSLSPDGTRIAVAVHDPAHPGVEIFPLDGGASSVLPVPGYGTVLGVSWTHGGSDLFVHTVSPSGYDLLYVNAGGTTTLLRQSPDMIWGIQSPDGRRLAYALNTDSNRNVWVGATQLGLR